MKPGEIRRQLKVVAERRAEAEAIQSRATKDLKRLIPQAEKADISMTEVAQLAGVSRVSLYEFMERHGIIRLGRPHP